MEQKRNACRFLVENPEGKSPLGIPRHKWVDNSLERENVMVWTGLMWLRTGTSRGLL
jgi:hypothetical protein